MILGMDLGGTHSDGVLIRGGEILVKKKVPTRRAELQETVLELSNALLPQKNFSDLSKIFFSSTLITNLLSRKETAPAGLFMIPGPGASPAFIANQIPYGFVAASGSIDHRGERISALQQGELLKAADFFKAAGIENVAVVSKFSTRNSSLEKQAADFFASCGFSVFEGAKFSGKLNFPRRCFTALLSASVSHDFSSALKALVEGLLKAGIKAPFFILKADGGAVSFEEALKNPLESVLSGPAAGMLGSLYHLRGFLEDAVSLDIGGTTTEMGFLVGGVPALEPQGIEVNGLPTLIRALKVYSLAIGGDSLFSFEGSEAVINNRRKGIPYCFGGPVSTLTDVFQALEKQDPKALEGVKNFSEKDLHRVALKAAEIIAAEVSRQVKSMNQGPIYTVNEFFHRRDFKPETLILSGGAAPFFEQTLKKVLGLKTVLSPHYGFCNALGAGFSKVSAEVNLFASTADGKLSIPEAGISQGISKSFSLEDAKQLALHQLKALSLQKGMAGEPEMEITDSQVFSVVRGFSTAGKNIRIRAQIKPGLREERYGP